MKKLILCMLVVAAAACMTVMGEEANLDVSLTVNPSFTIAWKADNNDAPGEDINSATMTEDASSGDYSAYVWIEGSTNIVNAVDIFISGDEYLSATINDTVYTIPYSISHDATASATSSFTPQGGITKHSFQIARPDETGADGNYVWDFSSRVKISASADDASKVPVASTGTTYTANLTATVQSAV